MTTSTTRTLLYKLLVTVARRGACRLYRAAIIMGPKMKIFVGEEEGMKIWRGKE